MNKINIAIDGYSSCGKSTVAKDLAKKTGYTYIDSGAMYRAAALYALRHKLMDAHTINQEKLQHHINNIDITFATSDDGSQQTILNGKNVEQQIRTPEIANAASQISTIGFLRSALVRKQQTMGIRKGVVMDGRDIGTVVFPDAELKIFLTASPEVRAKRRFEELMSKGVKTNYATVLANIKARDHRDTSRKESPLRKAQDAIVIDNSNMSIDEQLQHVLQLFNDKVKTHNEYHTNR